MSTTTEELKKLYKKLGGSENTTRAASTPAEVLNGINELDFGFNTDGDLKLAGENSDIILTDDENTWDGINKSLKDALAAASVDHIEFNPDEPATEDLEKLKGNGVVYGIPKFAISKEAEGNPITFADGADAPLVECEVEFEAQQDLHGQDKPWVGGAGKNKIPVLLSEVKSNNTDGTWSGDTYSYLGVTFKVDSNSEGYVTKITVNASSSSGAFSFYLQRVTTVYTVDMILNGCPSGGGDATYDLRVSGGYRDIGSGVTIPANTSFNVLWIVIRSGITVSNLVFEPMIRLSTVADPTFEPYSNICPISGYSEIGVDGRGKNLLDGTSIKFFQESESILTKNGLTLTRNSDGSFRINGTASADTRLLFTCAYVFKPSNSYTFSIKGFSSSGFRIIIFGANGSKSGLEYTSVYPTGDWSKTYNIVSDDTLSYFYLDVTSGSVVDSTLFAQIELGSATTYEPYKGTDYTISLGSTRYGGTLDIVRGVLRVTHGYVDLGDLTWSKGSTNRFYATLNGIKEPSSASVVGDIKSSQYIARSANATYSGVDGISAGNNAVYVYDSTKASMTAEDFTTAMDGVECVYELATPIEVSLTPTQVKSLLGNNTISTDGKTLSIEYITKGASAIIKLIKALMPKANPAGDATDTLNKLAVDGTVYSIPSGGGGGNTVLAQSLNTLTVTEV